LNPLPSTFLRGGTSKGIFIRRELLPDSREDWTKILLGLMGSPDAKYGRQLNGMGGGVSSLSKVCVVGKPNVYGGQTPKVDVEYTFVQVGIKDSILDVSGNCGNLSSMVGVFALDEGLVDSSNLIVKNDDPSSITVRCLNANTMKIVDTTFPTMQDPTTGKLVAKLDNETVEIAGVPGKASKIILDFIKPGGSRTAHTLPTGKPINNVEIKDPNFTEYDIWPSFDLSLVDATNPTVFIHENALNAYIHRKNEHPPAIFDLSDYAREDVLKLLEALRRSGAKHMGLDPTAQAQPKIAAVRAPTQEEQDKYEGLDIVVRALSMGVLHKAVPMTVGLCLGVACGLRGTHGWDIVREEEMKKEFVRILHPGGIVDVGASIDRHEYYKSTEWEVKSAKVVRTGRRLMVGSAWW
ncbi:DUF453-domain-containing protein, partial [Abortiporus biennis]